jgi:hypothetical protein
MGQFPKEASVAIWRISLTLHPARDDPTKEPKPVKNGTYNDQISILRMGRQAANISAQCHSQMSAKVSAHGLTLHTGVGSIPCAAGIELLTICHGSRDDIGSGEAIRCT